MPPLDIQQRVTNADGRIDFDAASAWDDAFTELLHASPEWQALPEHPDGDLALDILLGTSVEVMGKTVAQLTGDELQTLLHEVVPIELYYEDGEPARAIAAMRAVFQFLLRTYALPNADDCLRGLDGDAVVQRLADDIREEAASAEAEAASLPDLPGDLDEMDEEDALAAVEGTFERADAAGFSGDEITDRASALAEQPEHGDYERSRAKRESPASHAKAKRKMAKASRKKNRKK